MNPVAAGTVRFPIPVTCLHRIDYAGFRILLVGSGGVVEAINLYDFSRLCDSGLLLTQTIRCFVPISRSHYDNKQSTYQLLVQGGSQIAWVELCIETDGISIIKAHFKTIHKCHLDYWMICGRPSCNPGIATAFLTSYNVLYQVKINTLTKTLEWYRLNDKLTTFLYSGDFSEIDGHHYLVASGTAFGKVLVWSCVFDEHQGQWMTTPWQEFGGHEGSIFGVSISSHFQLGGKSRRLVASCSDDRTIRIWDVSHAMTEEKKHSKGTKLHEQTEEDTPKVSNVELTRTWAHVSRIWNVDLMFDAVLTPEHSNIGLISTGEDSTTQSWSLSLDNLWQSSSQKQKIWEHRYIDNHHSGRNIWSRCYTNNEKEVAFYTGGADGQIVVRSYNKFGRADQSAVRLSQMFKAISTTPESKGMTPPLERKPLVLKSYVVSMPTQLLATSDSGLLLKGTLREGTFAWHPITTGAQAVSYVLCRRLSAGVAFFIDCSTNLLLSFDTTTSNFNRFCELRHSKVAALEIACGMDDIVTEGLCTCLAISYFGSCELDLVWLQRGEYNSTLKSKFSIPLPQTFEVTSTCYDPEIQLFLAGSRTGAIVVYTNVSSTASQTIPACCRRHVHASDTVTSIQMLCEDNSDINFAHFYLTTGRDGTYCVIQIILALPPQIRVVHQTTPPLGPNIEGAHLIPQADGSKKILLYGFHSTNFVVWDESHQTQVMSVDCGGAHRNWAFSCNDKTGEDNKFVWTKAGTLMYHRQTQADHKIIRSGGHGREIKALAVTNIDKQKTLIATGSEDTDIRIFELSKCNVAGRQLKCLAVLRRHTTGLQDLKFSSAGDMLFSAAGMEELYAWKLTAVPVIKQGICFAGALQKHDAWSDARIMSIDIRDIINETTSMNYVLVGAFSSGKVKVVKYSTSLDDGEIGTFTILNQLDWGAICLTQAQFRNGSSKGQDMAVVAGTKGSVRVYHTGDIFGNGYQNEPNWMPPAHRIHQNSVTALQAVNLNSSVQLLVTGGDDNALAISLCQINTDMNDTTRFQTLIIPKAHAAALTALVVLDLDSALEPSPSSEPNVRRRFMIVTAGNDQRVKTWELTIDTQRYASTLYNSDQQQDAMEYIEVEQIDDVHTNVADISEVEILQRTSCPGQSEIRQDAEDHEKAQSRWERVEVLVVGVGMEAVNLEVPSGLTQ